MQTGDKLATPTAKLLIYGMVRRPTLTAVKAGDDVREGTGDYDGLDGNYAGWGYKRVKQQ